MTGSRIGSAAWYNTPDAQQMSKRLPLRSMNWVKSPRRNVVESDIAFLMTKHFRKLMRSPSIEYVLSLRLSPW